MAPLQNQSFLELHVYINPLNTKSQFFFLISKQLSFVKVGSVGDILWLASHFVLHFIQRDRKHNNDVLYGTRYLSLKSEPSLLNLYV